MITYNYIGVKMADRFLKHIVNTDFFSKGILSVLSKLCDKRVLIYSKYHDYKFLNKIFHFDERLNVQGVFYSDKSVFPLFKNKLFLTLDEAKKTCYDYILVLDSANQRASKFFLTTNGFDVDKVIFPCEEEVYDQTENSKYLFDINFIRQFSKLQKKLKNKTVILYGAGAFLELISKYCDLSLLNIVAICDKRFKADANDKFLGYKAISVKELSLYKADYILISTREYLKTQDWLFDNLEDFKRTKVKLLFKRPFRLVVEDVLK